MLMESFRNQPWLGFEVVGGLPRPETGAAFLTTGPGNLQQLVEDAKSGQDS
ncbi:hypothetical protein C22711_0565 [Escherichia coli O104:H4 str. C227-11]|nr:hypothetical protein C22711_0565 [Escherichia coli O104:H4 str. C227-11]